MLTVVSDLDYENIGALSQNIFLQITLYICR